MGSKLQPAPGNSPECLLHGLICETGSQAHQHRKERTDGLTPISITADFGGGKEGNCGILTNDRGKLISAVGERAGKVQTAIAQAVMPRPAADKSEEHKSELQSLMRNSYAVFCLKKKRKIRTTKQQNRD